MKRIWILICLAVMLLTLVGCEKATKTPIDVRYTPGETVVVYDYSFNILGGKLKGRPEFKEIPPKYEVMYELSWSDGTKRIEDFYRTVTKEEYDRACDFLEGTDGKA